MNGINVGRWLLGGAVAGIILWIIEGAASMLYVRDMEAALTAHNLSMPMTPALFLLGVLVSLIAGLTLVFLYAAARSRFGPGPRTALIVALAMWIGGYFLSLCGYYMLGLFPGRMLALWGGVGLVEMIAGALVGGWIYREAPSARP